MLMMNDHEIDLTVEKIRNRLLVPRQHHYSNPLGGGGGGGGGSGGGAVGANNSGSGGSGAGSGAGKPGSTGNVFSNNPLREGRILSQVFRHININGDAVLTNNEILDLTSKLEIFITEEEARKVYKKMDADHDDSVDEADFIHFMKRSSEVTVNKAHRIREAAATLRRWLLRGSSTTTAAAASASQQQWAHFKQRHEAFSGQRFQDFLSAEDLLLTLASQGVRLSQIEARELVLLVAPEKGTGRIHQADLHSFMSRASRTFGELIAVLDRELLRDLVEAYRAHRKATLSDGLSDPDLQEKFSSAVRALVRRVQGSNSGGSSSSVSVSSTSSLGNNVTALGVGGSASTGASGVGIHDVVSVAQLKTGIESASGSV